MEKTENKLKKKSVDFFPYTNVIGLSRSILALGTLLTLLCNSKDVIVEKINGNHFVNPALNQITFINKFNFFVIFGIDNYEYTRIVAIIILAMVISGYFMKITSILHWWVTLSFFLFSTIIDGGDQITSILTLLLIPICLTDRRKNHWSKIEKYESSNNLIAIVAIYLIRVQVAVVYLWASMGKMMVEEWKNGTAIYYWVNHSFFGMPTYMSSFINYLLSNNFIVCSITYGVLILEILLFLGLTASVKYRKRILYIAILFHLSIIIFHGIFSFFFAMFGGLILFLYPTYININFKSWKKETLLLFT